MNTVTDSGQGLLHLSRGAQRLSESVSWLNAVKLPLLRTHPFQHGKKERKATALEHMGGEHWDVWDTGLQRRVKQSTASLMFTCSFSIKHLSTQNQKASAPWKENMWGAGVFSPSLLLRGLSSLIYFALCKAERQGLSAIATAYLPKSTKSTMPPHVRHCDQMQNKNNLHVLFFPLYRSLNSQYSQKSYYYSTNLNKSWSQRDGFCKIFDSA